MYYVAILHFADNAKVWVLAFEGPGPFVPESIGHVLPRIHANPVHARRADPPERVLNQITRDFRIVLIEIGQEVQEPTFHGCLFQTLNRTRIVQHPGLKDIGQVVLLRAVEPGRRRRIIDPGMIRAGVIYHFVLDDLEVKFVRGCDELAQFCERAKVFFDCVEVLRIVTMKAGAGLAFL